VSQRFVVLLRYELQHAVGHQRAVTVEVEALQREAGLQDPDELRAVDLQGHDVHAQVGTHADLWEDRVNLTKWSKTLAGNLPPPLARRQRNKDTRVWHYHCFPIVLGSGPFQRFEFQGGAVEQQREAMQRRPLRRRQQSAELRCQISEIHGQRIKIR